MWGISSLLWLHQWQSQPQPHLQANLAVAFPFNRTVAFVLNLAMPLPLIAVSVELGLLM